VGQDQRAYFVSPSFTLSRERHDPLPHGFLAWIPAILKMDARDIIHKNGLDAYVFVRFLWLMCELFFPL
jgi:calcium permeable stress-gated cation channel